MFIIGNFLIAIANVVNILLNMLVFIIFVRAFISWFSPDPYNPLVQILYRITEPILEPIRRFIPMARIDISPIIAFVLIIFIQSFLVQTLVDLGSRLKSQRQSNIQTIEFTPSEGEIRSESSQYFN